MVWFSSVPQFIPLSSGVPVATIMKEKDTGLLFVHIIINSISIEQKNNSDVNSTKILIVFISQKSYELKASAFCYDAYTLFYPFKLFHVILGFNQNAVFIYISSFGTPNVRNCHCKPFVLENH